MSHRRSRQGSEIDQKEMTRNALIVTGLIWGLLIYMTTYEVSFHEKLGGVLGNKPGGMELDLFLLVFTFQLCLPMIFFLRHTFITIYYARQHKDKVLPSGTLIKLAGYLVYLVRDTGEGAVIERSKRITFAGLLYFFGIIVWWIIWTEHHGI